MKSIDKVHRVCQSTQSTMEPKTVNRFFTIRTPKSTHQTAALLAVLVRGNVGKWCVRNQPLETSRPIHRIHSGDLIFVTRTVYQPRSRRGCSSIWSNEGLWLELMTANHLGELISGWCWMENKPVLTNPPVQPSTLGVAHLLTPNTMTNLLQSKSTTQFVSRCIQIVHTERTNMLAVIRKHQQAQQQQRQVEIQQLRAKLANTTAALESLSLDHCIQLSAERTSTRMEPIHRELLKRFRLFRGTGGV